MLHLWSFYREEELTLLVFCSSSKISNLFSSLEGSEVLGVRSGPLLHFVSALVCSGMFPPAAGTRRPPKSLQPLIQNVRWSPGPLILNIRWSAGPLIESIRRSSGALVDNLG
jgi:hypothetical protein